MKERNPTFFDLFAGEVEMARFKDTNEMVGWAVRIARSLPADPRLHRLGYERAVKEVEAAFQAAIQLLREEGPVAGCLRLRGGPGRHGPDCGWDRPGLLAALGRELEIEHQAGKEVGHGLD